MHIIRIIFPKTIDLQVKKDKNQHKHNNKLRKCKCTRSLKAFCLPQSDKIQNQNGKFIIWDVMFHQMVWIQMESGERHEK